MSAAAVSILIGALASQGLGEQRFSTLAGLEVETNRVRISARFDHARKVESGKGWIGTGSLVGKVGVLRLGGSYVHRSAGTWTKDTFWLEPGLAKGPLEVTFRASVSGDTEREMGARVRLDVGRWIVLESQALRHHEGQVGFTSAVSFRLGGAR